MISPGQGLVHDSHEILIEIEIVFENQGVVVG